MLNFNFSEKRLGLVSPPHFVYDYELSQNRTEKQIMPFKTTVNWLFNDLCCYLVTGFFD